MSLKNLSSDADEKCVFISALTGDGIDDFTAALEELILHGKREVMLKLSHADAGVLSTVYNIMENVSVEYTEEGMTVTALADTKSAGQLRKYVVGYDEMYPDVE